MKTLAPVHSPPLRVFQPSLQNGHEGMSSAAVFASSGRVKTYESTSIIGNDSSNKATYWGIYPLSLSLFADALQPLSNSQVQRIKCTACQHNLWRSLKVQSAQRRTTKERIDNSAEGNPSSNMFHHPTNSTIPCLQKCPASHHLNGFLTHGMACSTQCLLIQRFSDLCGSLAVWKMENHGDLWTFSAFGGF